MLALRKWVLQVFILCFITTLNILPTLAQDAEIAGRAVTKQDWINFMPVFIGSIIIVLAVDAFFILPIFRKNNEKKEEL